MDSRPVEVASLDKIIPPADLERIRRHDAIDLNDPVVDSTINDAAALAKKVAEDLKSGTMAEERTSAEKPAKPVVASDASTTPPVTPLVASASAAAAAMPATMAGAVFERFARQLMAFSFTTAVTYVAPQPSGAQFVSTRPEAPIDPEDDKPDYVKEIERMATPPEPLPLPEPEKKPASSDPGGLDNFVISATHQTDFDLEDSQMTFSGSVDVIAPRFHLTCDRFIVHMRKERKGMAYGEAIGNVVIRMLENRRPTGHVGTSRKAVYRPDEGQITLSGWPRIRQETKELVAVTADTKMLLYTSGRVKTQGRARTILRH